MEDKRSGVQNSATLNLVQNDFNNIILFLSPRVGKSKIVLDAFKGYVKLSSNPKALNLKILIIAPFNPILKSWKNEIIKWKAEHLDITLLNQRSLSKVKLGQYDIIVVDEVHELSLKQILQLNSLKSKSKIFGITGSLSEDTENNLKYQLGLEVKFRYPIEMAIKDGIISDYKIRVIYTSLDNVNKTVQAGNKFKQFMTTEQEAYDYYTREFEKHKELGNTTTKMFFAGLRSRLVYSSKNKLSLAKKLISNSSRVLIFTTLTKVADELCSHSYHSKSTENNLDKFQEMSINKLAVVNMTNMGITFKDLKHAICLQLTSNSETTLQKLLRTMNLDNISKVAEIDVIVLKNTIDEIWLQSSLKDFDKSKIEYINEQDLKI